MVEEERAVCPWSVVQSPAPVSTRMQLAGFSSQFFQPSPVDGHFNHFQSCPITNNAVKKKKKLHAWFISRHTGDMCS